MKAKKCSIGWASIDITPDRPVFVAGQMYPRISTVVLEPLTATAVVFEQEGEQFTLLSADVVNFNVDVIRRVRDKLAGVQGLDPMRVAFCATHTHSGPATLFGGDGLNDLDRQYLADLKGKLADVAVAAFRSAEPGRLETTWTEAPSLAHNRRVKGEDGAWGNEWWDPDGKHPGYVDPSVMLVGVRRPDGCRRTGLRTGRPAAAAGRRVPVVPGHALV